MRSSREMGTPKMQISVVGCSGLDWIDISLHKVRAFPSSLGLCNSANFVLEEFQWVADIVSFTLINC